MTKIYYNPNYQTIKATNSPAQTDLSHPLFIPEYYIPPQRYIDYAKEQHKDHSYYKCPAWKQYWANTFVVFNQMDINFKWQKSDGLVYDSSFDRNKAADDIFIQEGKIQAYDSAKSSNPYQFRDFLVIQWSQSMMFWPEKPNKNLWIELIPAPELHHKTGMELIAAEIPLGRWYRSVNGAYRCHATDVKVPRGTPLYCVRFRGSKDNSYDIERWKDFEPPNEVQRKFRLNQGIKNWLPGKSWGMIKDDVEEESKCPFSFLWKNDNN